MMSVVNSTPASSGAGEPTRRRATYGSWQDSDLDRLWEPEVERQDEALRTADQQVCWAQLTRTLSCKH